MKNLFHFTLQCLFIYSVLYNRMGKCSLQWMVNCKIVLYFAAQKEIKKGHTMPHKKQVSHVIMLNKWCWTTAIPIPIKIDDTRNLKRNSNKFFTIYCLMVWHSELMVPIRKSIGRKIWENQFCLIIRLQFIGSLFGIHFANVSTCDDWHISLHLYW